MNYLSFLLDDIVVIVPFKSARAKNASGTRSGGTKHMTGPSAATQTRRIFAPGMRRSGRTK
jgi:hypothetical protein